MNAHAQDIPDKPFDAEDYDIFGYSVKVTLPSALTQMSCPKTLRLLCLGKERKRNTIPLRLHFPNSVIFTYYQAHDIITITASLNILKSLLTQSRKAGLSPRILTPSHTALLVSQP